MMVFVHNRLAALDEQPAGGIVSRSPLKVARFPVEFDQRADLLKRQSQCPLAQSRNELPSGGGGPSAPLSV